MSTDYPCPDWCREAESRPSHVGEVDWSDYETYASRPHNTAAIQRTEGAALTSQGSQGLRIDIGADEVAPVLADGTRGPSLLEEPLIRIDVWVQTADHIDEVTYDMFQPLGAIRGLSA